MLSPSPSLRPVLPEWQVSHWLNTPQPLSLAGLRGRVVLLHSFQMLCPGCVSHGLPQAERVRQAFSGSALAVVGLHTVFEHHEAMNPAALQAFVHEYRWSVPIGVDAPGRPGGPSRSMSAYGLQGTPSLLLLDHEGRVALHHFGRLDDLVLGAHIGQLIEQAQAAPAIAVAAPPEAGEVCTPQGCGPLAGGRP